MTTDVAMESRRRSWNVSPFTSVLPSISQLLVETKKYQDMKNFTLVARMQNSMNLQCSEIVLYQQWVKHFKICLKHQIPYYYSLTDWLLAATICNHRKMPPNMHFISNSLFEVAAIFDYSKWLPFMRSNMADNASHYLYSNLKFSKCSDFSNVHLLPCMLVPCTVAVCDSRVCTWLMCMPPTPPSTKQSSNHTGSSDEPSIICSYMYRPFWCLFFTIPVIFIN